MRYPTCLITLLLLTGCTDAETRTAGHLENPAISEASGLAGSSISDDRLWVINDGGHGPFLYAINLGGDDLGTVEIEGASNRDWEDIASFTMGGKPMLLIADIGDNMGLRRSLTLYVIEEPMPDAHSVILEWRIEVSLPDGAADAEAIAVDSDAGIIFLLTKRDIPAKLYTLPLSRPDGPATEKVATLLGTIPSLPQPTAEDRANALRDKNWYWQPTGMDVAPDGKVAVILTYRGLYYYRRSMQEDWFSTFQLMPSSIDFKDVSEAESVAFSTDGKLTFVTTEQRHAPLLKIKSPGE